MNQRLVSNPGSSNELIGQMAAIGLAAKNAAAQLAQSSAAVKNAGLKAAATALIAAQSKILAANAADVADAKGRQLGAAMIDRLALDEERIVGMARGLEDVAALPDPVGTVLAEWIRPNGLRIKRVRVPLGVVGIIYESRPNVTADAAGLCLKAGNACILRGGSESFRSNQAIFEALQSGLSKAGLPKGAIQLVPTIDRAAVGVMLGMADVIDVIVPRGGKSLITRVQAESKIPVLAHLEGNCHVYVDGASDLTMARQVVMNSKMRRTGVCGAAETLLVDRACAGTHLRPLVEDLLDAGCEVRGDSATQDLDSRVKAAVDADWATEFLDAIIAVKVVDGVDDAIRHIGAHGSHHTESIVTNDPVAANRFLNEIDSAILLHNASTQFADGGEFGMGAEIGIATGKLHARGPVGVEQLTSFKYVVRGTGQVRP
jgi:glutamate-5-semialdehyde dehydrogenase